MPHSVCSSSRKTRLSLLSGVECCHRCCPIFPLFVRSCHAVERERELNACKKKLKGRMRMGLWRDPVLFFVGFAQCMKLLVVVQYFIRKYPYLTLQQIILNFAPNDEFEGFNHDSDRYRRGSYLSTTTSSSKCPPSSPTLRRAQKLPSRHPIPSLSIDGSMAFARAPLINR